VCNFRLLRGGSERVLSVCHEIRRLSGVRTDSEKDLERNLSGSCLLLMLIDVRFRELLNFGVVFDSFEWTFVISN
jgi:hypothetical protein